MVMNQYRYLPLHHLVGAKREHRLPGVKVSFIST